MLIVGEETASRLVTMKEAISAVEDAFSEMAQGRAENFPVVMGRELAKGNMFSCKSGAVASIGALGVKIGSYWPENRSIGIPAHASTILLLDPATGLPKALIAATHLTALRTAASDGVAVRHLSRADSQSIALVGAGHQAWFELMAVCEVRDIRRLRVWCRETEEAANFALRAQLELGLIDSKASSLEEAVSTSDIVVTVTPSKEPLVRHEWVRPGTHISAMGSDALGKRELDTRLVATAALFADVVDQSVSLGDFEDAFNSGLITKSAITSIGSVISGTAPGRTDKNVITIYDSSGTAIQDLAIGAIALSKAMACELVERPAFLKSPSEEHEHRSIPS